MAHGEEKSFDQSTKVDFFSRVEFGACKFDNGHNGESVRKLSYNQLILWLADFRDVDDRSCRSNQEQATNS